MEDTTTPQKVAFKEMCRFPSADNKTRHKRIRNQTRKVVVAAMRKKAEQVLNSLCRNSLGVLSFLKGMKKKGNDFAGVGCFR